MKINILTARQHTVFKMIALVSSITLLLLLTSLPASTTIAQSASSEPIVTLTSTPYTPEPSQTPSITPTSIPTLSSSFPMRSVITSSNANQIGKFRSWQAHNGWVNGLAFIPNSTYLASVGNEFGQADPTPIRLWAIQDENVNQIKGFFESIPQYGVDGFTGVRLSLDGTRIIAFGGGVMVWDAQTGDLIGRVLQAAENAYTLSADNQTLVIGSLTGLVGIWRIPPNKPDKNGELPLPDDFFFNPQGILLGAFQIDEPISQLDYSLDTSQAFVLTKTGKLNIYSLFVEDYGIQITPTAGSQMVSYPSLTGYDEVGRRLALKPNSHLLAYTSSDHVVIIYDYSVNQIITRYPMVTPASCLTYSPDGALLMIGDWTLDTSLQIINTTSGEIVAQVKTGKIISCAFSSDGTLVATGDTNGQITFWGVP